MTVLESTGQIISGLGLFLTGMRLVSSGLKEMTGARFRKLMIRWTGNRYLAGLWGFLSGAVTQSSANTTFIVVSLISSGILSVGAAIPIVAMSNAGNAVLVFVASLNIRLMVLYLLGISGVLYGLIRQKRQQAALHALFGISMLLFGFHLIKSGAGPISQTEWAQDLVQMSAGSIWISFLAGGVLRFIAQSSSTVSIIAMTMGLSGLIQLDQAMMMINGMYIGSALTVYLLSAGVRGTPRQIAIYQALFNLTGSIVLVFLFLLESFSGVPLIGALARYLSTDIARQIALLFLISRMIPIIVTLPLHKPIVRLLTKLSPALPEEDLSRPAFMHDQMMDDPEVALDLISLEQARLIGHLPGFLYPWLEETQSSKAALTPQTLTIALQTLSGEIEQALQNLLSRNLTRDTVARIVNLQSRQERISIMLKTLHHFTGALAGNHLSESMRKIRGNLVQALHAGLLAFLDAAEGKDAADLDMLLTITEDRKGVMKSIRQQYLTGSESIREEERPALLSLTESLQRIVWMIHQWAELKAEESDVTLSGQENGTEPLR